MPRRKPQPASLVQWYRLGLGVVALGVGTVLLLRATTEGGAAALVVAGLVLLAFGAWRIRTGWNLLGIRRVR